jgi:pyruvate ferredoxin oxidoreductase beta subunit
VANLRDLEQKVTTAMEIHGARYIHIHVPCPLGWGSAPADTIKVARLAVESGLFPLFEAHDGHVTARTPIRRPVPVDAYLKLQKRFAHLFANAAGRESIARIQAAADRNIAEFGLLADEGLHG